MRALRVRDLCMAGVLLAGMSMTATAAGVTATDLQIMGRALTFLEKPPRGDINVGIVYAVGNAQSMREAEDLRALIGNGLKVGNLTLRPVMVKLGDASTANVGLFLLTAGAGGDAASLAAVSTRRRIACVTTDIAQVRAGNCMMGIRSLPKIEILVSRAAALRSGMAFSSVFRMMITEI